MWHVRYNDSYGTVFNEQLKQEKHEKKDIFQFIYAQIKSTVDLRHK